MATCLDLAGAKYPKQLEGREITPLEGEPLTPIFKGEQRPPHDFIAWEHFGARAIRQGDWKLVARKDARWELYDLSIDRTETNDLAAANPGRVKEMSAHWEQWAQANQVHPAPPR
jgi:arylsulfatase